jgi:pimeloyl-ACP methyl ester carboxylesterase
VHGDRDQFFPVSIPVEMYRSIPNSSLWIVPEGGHVPIFGENRAEFVRIISKFLAGDTAKADPAR